MYLPSISALWLPFAVFAYRGESVERWVLVEERGECKEDSGILTEESGA